MAEDLHGFVTGTLWLKLKEDMRVFRMFNRRDLVCAAYFHIRRLLLIQPGWSCRADLAPTPNAGHQSPASSPSDLALFSGSSFQALFQFEFHLTPGTKVAFPASEMNARMTDLRRAVADAEQLHPTGSGKSGRGYLIGIYDTEEEWFYPDQAVWEKQSCFWLPINCRGFADYAEWHPKWERFARLTRP